MAQSFFGKIRELIVGPARPAGYPQYQNVTIPWYTRLWQTIRPPARVPVERKPMSGKQRRIIWVSLCLVLLSGAGWAAYTYVAGAQGRSMALFEEGMLLLGPNDLEGARNKFSEAIAEWPENARAYLERGNVNRVLGNDAGASDDWARAIELNAGLTEAYTARATLHLSNGDLTQAMVDLNRAIEIAPDMNTYYQRAQVFHAMGEYQKAIDDYGRSIDQQRNAPFVYFARALSRAAIGDRHGAQEDRETAERIQRVLREKRF